VSRRFFDPANARIAALGASLGARMEFSAGPNDTSTPAAGQDLLESTSTVFNAQGSLSGQARGAYQTMVAQLLGAAPGTFYRLDWMNYSSGAQFGSTGGVADGTHPQMFMGPMMCNPGDLVGCNVTSTPGSATAFAAKLWGSRQRLIKVRADGRPYPTGALATNAALVGAGSVTMVTPPAGTRIMIRSLNLSTELEGANGNLANIASTFAGTFAAIVTMPLYGATALSQDWESGLLCDIAQAVVLQIGGGGSAGGSLAYDLTV
jgi:hypothetical protein